MQILTFRYRQNPISLIFSTLILWGTAVGIVLMILDDAFAEIPGAPLPVRWFFMAMAAFCLICGLVLLRSLWGGKQITLTETDLIAPKKVASPTMVTVPLSSISGTRSRSFLGQEILTIDHAQGTLLIATNLLGGRKIRNALKAALAERGRTAGNLSPSAPP